MAMETEERTVVNDGTEFTPEELAELGVEPDAEASETETSPEGDNQSGAEGEPNADPLKGLTIEQILQHPTLSREVQSRIDRAANANTRAELARWEREAEQGAIEKRFQEMTNDELVEFLDSDPKAREQFGDFVSRQRDAKEQGENQMAVGLAKTLSIGRELQATMKELSEMGIAAEGELDPEIYVERGEEGFSEWAGKARQAIYRGHGQKVFDSELKDGLDIAIEERLAERDATRKPSLLPNAGGNGARSLEALAASGSDEDFYRAMAAESGKK